MSHGEDSRLTYDPKGEGYIYERHSSWIAVRLKVLKKSHDNCDCLYINHPFSTKCKFWVGPKITVMSTQD